MTSRPPRVPRPRRRRRRRPAEDRHPLDSSLPTAAPDRRRDQVQKSGAGERESHRSSRPPTLARLRAGLFLGGARPERNGQRAEDSSCQAARRGAQGRPGDLRGGLPWHQRAAGRRAARRSARRRYPLPRRQESSHPARRRRRRDRHAQGAPERADRPGTRQGRRRPSGQDTQPPRLRVGAARLQGRPDGRGGARPSTPSSLARSPAHSPVWSAALAR